MFLLLLWTICPQQFSSPFRLSPCTARYINSNSSCFISWQNPVHKPSKSSSLVAWQTDTTSPAYGVYRGALSPCQPLYCLGWVAVVNGPLPVASSGPVIHRRGSRQAAIVMVNWVLNGRGWAGRTHIKQRRTGREGGQTNRPPQRWHTCQMAEIHSFWSRWIYALLIIHSKNNNKTHLWCKKVKFK